MTTAGAGEWNFSSCEAYELRSLGGQFYLLCLRSWNQLMTQPGDSALRKTTYSYLENGWGQYPRRQSVRIENNCIFDRHSDQCAMSRY